MEEKKTVLLWGVAILNGLVGFLLIINAFLPMESDPGIDLFYLAVGVINLVASVVWFLNIRRY